VRLKSCPYCGRIHKADFDCGKKPPKIRRYSTDPTPADTIRNSYRWQKVRERIKERDHYLCRLCISGYGGRGAELNSKDIEVHHIIPIEQDESKAFDDDNLITLCRYHHDLAEGEGVGMVVLLQTLARADIILPDFSPAPGQVTPKGPEDTRPV